MTHCVSFDRKSNSVAAFAINRCSEPVVVGFLYTGENLGPSSVSISANSRQSISQGKGDVNYYACAQSEAFGVEHGGGRLWKCRLNFDRR